MNCAIIARMEQAELARLALIGALAERRKLDEQIEELEKLAAAQKERWRKIHAAAEEPPRRGKRKLSEEARKRMSIATRKRWKKIRASNPEAINLSTQLAESA